MSIKMQFPMSNINKSKESKENLEVDFKDVKPLIATFLSLPEVEKFFEKEGDAVEWIAKDKIGVEGLAKVFTRDQIAQAVGWDYVKQYFYENLDVTEVLNHIGYDTVREHFKDKITQKDDKNDINTHEVSEAVSGGLMGALNDEGDSE